MKAAELRSKSGQELKDLLNSQRREQFRLRLLKSSGDFQKIDQFKKIRRTIARIETILAQSEDKA
jgi:large subunit ribosomal protein L29